jgi:uncharacterized membrane protein required for colicin V production
MEALAGAGFIVTIFGIIIGIMIAIAPLMIWSKTSQMVQLLKETNLYLRQLAAAQGAALPPTHGYPPAGPPR